MVEVPSLSFKSRGRERKKKLWSDLAWLGLAQLTRAMAASKFMHGGKKRDERSSFFDFFSRKSAMDLLQVSL